MASWDEADNPGWNRNLKGRRSTTHESGKIFASDALADKVALVTGAGSGIGRAIAIAFGAAGARVIVNYHSEHGRAEAEEVARQAGRGAEAVRADVGDEEAVAELFRQVDERCGRLDVLVNNAGIESEPTTIDAYPVATFDRIVATNLRGTFLCMRQAAQRMVAAGHGRIINISSVHEDLAFPGNSAYAATKGGVRMLMRTTALELAPHGVTVVNLAPGAVATPINRGTLADPQLRDELLDEIPLGRVAQPDEIANAAVFLAGDGASYLTATTVFVDGGLMHATKGL
ncbi:MAG TPA: SDR family oxidoreductase [Candidatus Limnocylindria bacterium]|nr:SDR family oxidoreductase [Candidatus Limnocylindria bacterium]